MSHRFSTRAICVVATIALLAGIHLTSAVTVAEIAPDAQALAKLDDEWSKTAATRDAAKIAAYYAEDAIAYPPNAPAAVGRAAAQKVWESIFVEPSFAISWKTTHASMAKSGEMGFTSGTYTATWIGEGGKAMVPEVDGPDDPL